jgi:regulator of RNase E activity RraA
MGEPVEIGSLQIRSGDLLHADCHGVQTIPIETAAKLPGVVSGIEAREGELIRLCKRSDFSIEKLVEALRNGNEHFPSLPH